MYDNVNHQKSSDSASHAVAFSASAPAPVLAAPLCPQGLPGAWRCGSGNGSLLFDEATYQVSYISCIILQSAMVQIGCRAAP